MNSMINIWVWNMNNWQDFFFAFESHYFLLRKYIDIILSSLFTLSLCCLKWIVSVVEEKKSLYYISIYVFVCLCCFEIVEKSTCALVFALCSFRELKINSLPSSFFCLFVNVNLKIWIKNFNERAWNAKYINLFFNCIYLTNQQRTKMNS